MAFGMSEGPSKRPLPKNPFVHLGIAIAFTIPFIVVLPLVTFLLIGLLVGIMTPIIADFFYRREHGCSMVEACYQKILEKTPDYNRHEVEMSEGFYKGLSGVLFFAMSIFPALILWPGQLVMRMIIRTFPIFALEEEIKS